MKKRIRKLGIPLAILVVMLACQNPLTSSTQNTGLIQTQTSLAETLAAINNPAPTNTIAPPPTEMIQSTDTPETGSGLSSEEMATKIASAKVLIYEDVAGYASYIPIVSKAVASLTSNYTYVGDAVGTFQTKMETGTKWDLIVVSSEFKNKIQGNFWTTILQNVDNDYTALIVENIFLDKIAPYEIKPLMQECGIQFQNIWNRGAGFKSIDYAMYWVVNGSPVFNTPNMVERFRYSMTNARLGTAGDFVKLTSNSNATILASLKEGDSTDMGLVTSCVKGTVLFQTFRTHDYDGDEMLALWQNYITFVLTNHFQIAK